MDDKAWGRFYIDFDMILETVFVGNIERKVTSLTYTVNLFWKEDQHHAGGQETSRNGARQ